MKTFLVNKNDTLNTSYLPVVNFDTGFLFLGDFLIVRNHIINNVGGLRCRLRVTRKQTTRWILNTKHYSCKN
jgi:hypothetical protein